MRIAFYGGNLIPIHARSLEERPLGGTETGLIRVADILAQRGLDVTVFTTHQNPPPSTPRYLSHRSVMEQGVFDLGILIQDWQPAVLGFPARRLMFWTGDGYEQYSNFGLGDQRVAKRLERLLVASEWHKRTLCEASGFPEGQTVVVGNGVHLPWYSSPRFVDPVQRARKRMIYTSAPYRGLKLIPQIYPGLLANHPDVELHIFSGMNIYDREQPFQGPQVAEFNRLKPVLESLPRVVLHGNVRQEQLAEALMQSSLWIYPNIIEETCCISAIEAMAAGCPAIASSISALPETIGDGGVVVRGTPGSADYLRAFTEATDRLLSNDALWLDLSRRARARVERHFLWEHVADRFQALL